VVNIFYSFFGGGRGGGHACTDVLDMFFALGWGPLVYFAANPLGFRFYSVGGSAPQVLTVSGCNVLLERKIKKNML
jgi:hypothetical protein